MSNGIRGLRREYDTADDLRGTGCPGRRLARHPQELTQRIISNRCKICTRGFWRSKNVNTTSPKTTSSTSVIVKNYVKSIRNLYSGEFGGRKLWIRHRQRPPIDLVPRVSTIVSSTRFIKTNSGIFFSGKLYIESIYFGIFGPNLKLE